MGAFQMANGNSPAMFNKTDSLATNSADVILLIARLLMGWIFLKVGWDHLMNPAGMVGYLTALGAPAPSVLAWPALIAELLIGIGLILGIATRYVALLTVLWLIIATWLAHRYWVYPDATPGQPALSASSGNQFAHMLKNLSMIGGALVLFVTGAGRISVDDKMK
jgi:putative oxidoreductase